MAEIKNELRASFLAHTNDPGHLEPVIVTLRPGVDTSRLEIAGMLIENRIRSRPIVSGRINAAAFKTLSQSADVVRIEADSEMHVL
jgi:hypothetical protein